MQFLYHAQDNARNQLETIRTNKEDCTHHTSIRCPFCTHFWRRRGTTVKHSTLCPYCKIWTILWRSIWLGTASNYKKK